MKRNIFILAVFLMFLTGVPTADAFSDVKLENEQGRAIVSLENQGIISGYTDGTFKPANNIKRSHAAKLVVGALNLDLENVQNPNYKDVPSTHLYYKYIAAMENANIFSESNGNFYPEKFLTRGEMAKILVNAYKLKGGKSTNFTDVENTNFKEDIEILYSNKITTGVTSTLYGTNNPVTRGQYATFIHRIQKLKKTNPLNGEWNGKYSNDTGELKLKWVIDQGVIVVNFGPAEGNVKGKSGSNYGFINYNDETGLFSLSKQNWISQPNNWMFMEFEGAISHNNTLVGFAKSSNKVYTFELTNSDSKDDDLSVFLDGVWTGTSNMTNGGIQTAKYTFNNNTGAYEFGPTTQSSNVRSGSYNLKITPDPSGLFAIKPTTWIDQPAGYTATEALAVLSKKDYIIGFRQNNPDARIQIKKEY